VDDHPTIASLYEATYGILFFVTPHNGLVVEDMTKLLNDEPGHPATCSAARDPRKIEHFNLPTSRFQKHDS
jgi:hypothetical protein